MSILEEIIEKTGNSELVEYFNQHADSIEATYTQVLQHQGDAEAIQLYVQENPYVKGLKAYGNCIEGGFVFGWMRFDLWVDSNRDERTGQAGPTKHIIFSAGTVGLQIGVKDSYVTGSFDGTNSDYMIGDANCLGVIDFALGVGIGIYFFQRPGRGFFGHLIGYGLGLDINALSINVSGGFSYD